MVRRPNPKYVDAVLAEEVDVQEPTSYEEAHRSVEWQKDMDEEISALKKNQTWDLVPKPKEVKAISCRWIA